MKTKTDRAKPAASARAKKRWQTPRLTFQKDPGAIPDDSAPKETLAKRSPGRRSAR